MLEWVLSGVRTDWTSPAFLSSLANPAAFCSTYLLGQPDGQGGVEVGGREARWTIYHEVHQIFRVLQRLTVDQQGGPPSPGGGSSTPSTGALCCARVCHASHAYCCVLRRDYVLLLFFRNLVLYYFVYVSPLVSCAPLVPCTAHTAYTAYTAYQCCCLFAHFSL